MQLERRGTFDADTMITWKKRIITAVAISIPIVAIFLLANMMAPVQEGSSAGFWNNACGVSLQGKEGRSFGGFYQPRNGWYIYYLQGYHGQFLFRVPREKAIADFPEVVRQIKTMAHAKEPAPKVEWAVAVLERNAANGVLTPDRFLSLLGEEMLNALRERDLSHYRYVVSEEIEFTERWQRIQRYWATILFEAVFFTVFILFALWPWLHNKSRLCWGIHIGSLPLLLMLPFYLGYASWTFTSVGPSGGVLYPWVIVWLRFPIWTDADQWLVEHLPQLLAPLSQSLGPMLSISGGGALGPMAAFIIGLGITVCITWINLPNAVKIFPRN